MSNATSSPPALSSHWPLPQGVVDLFFEDAAGKRDLEARLRRLFGTWAYSELIPPTFEYADTLASEGGTQLAEEMYRFVDRDGRTLALRPDLTIPTARVVGTRLYDQPLPLRLFYVGSVFRYERPQAGRQREFTQAGMELVGAATPEADAEVLALTVEALRTAGLAGFQIALGQMAFFRGLLGELGLAPAAIAEIQQAIDRKNGAVLEACLDRHGVHGQPRRILLAMPVWHGGAAVLEAAREHCLNRAMQDALDRLLAIQDLLMRYGLAGAVAFDLGETRGMEYYTGITFKGYAPGLGFSVCSGGRYDDLVGHFGPPQPAVGCALWLDRILLVRQRQGREPIIPGVDVLVALADDAGCLGVVQALRHQGRRVEVDVTSRDPAALKRHTQHRGTGRLVICHGNGRLSLWQEGRETEMDVAGLLEEASTW